MMNGFEGEKMSEVGLRFELNSKLAEILQQNNNSNNNNINNNNNNGSNNNSGNNSNNLFVYSKNQNSFFCKILFSLDVFFS